ncbi:MAG: chloride channel protein [Chitinophagaceae bacterium]|nr:chloride channel protein [Chitinophagaceae bacterium]
MKFINTVKLFLKQKLDLIHNERVKKNLLNALPFWLGALIAGAVAVLYAQLFAWAEHATHYIYHQASWSFFIISPICFVIAWWVVVKYAPFARGSGIPQVSAAIELSSPKHHIAIKSLLSLRVIFIKVVSSLVMVFGGGVIGREGPTIQISAAIFKKINDYLPDWYPKISKQNMIVTGAAAGLAAAFNTPLGGIVFAIEELTKTHFSFFKSALLTGVIIAGLTALNFLGPYLYLGYPSLEGVGKMVVFPILIVAIVTGIIGSATGKIILTIFKKKKALTKQYQQLLFAATCGLAIAALAYWVDSSVFGSGKEIMTETLFSHNKNVAWYVPILRILGSIISFSVGAAGGIFAPSLSAGASIGSLFGGWFQLSEPATNLIILCGMTGFLTSITRSPFTSSILVLEMTNSHNVIFYIMLSGLLANLVANMVSRTSFYDHLKEQYIHEVRTMQNKPTNNKEKPEDNELKGSVSAD